MNVIYLVFFCLFVVFVFLLVFLKKYNNIYLKKASLGGMLEPFEKWLVKNSAVGPFLAGKLCYVDFFFAGGPTSSPFLVLSCSFLESRRAPGPADADVSGLH
jgi:hypothetical protein